MPSRRSQSYSLVKSSRQEEMARKREERIQRAAMQKQKKMDSYLADDQNFSSFASQLGKMGLQLRDIPGDGNCLFRALGDQLEGHCRNHLKHRLNVVQYMDEHRKDFEPFVEDDIPFERHLQMLKKPGTFGGNDALVAFARAHQVNIVIHQLNQPVWHVPGTDKAGCRELHITYHNGEHYSSVRKLGDNTETPANIKLKITNPEDRAPDCGTQNGYTTYDNEDEFDEAYPDTVDGVARVVRDVVDVERHISNMTGCTDSTLIRESLEDHQYDVDLTIDFILRLTVKSSYSNKSSPSSSVHETASLSSHQTTDSGIWSDNGTGSRIFGRQDSLNSELDRHGQHKSSRSSISSGYDSCNGAKPKCPAPVSNKKRKELAKKEKKKRAEERHKQKFTGKVTQNESDEDTVIVTRDLAMLKV